MPIITETTSEVPKEDIDTSYSSNSIRRKCANDRGSIDINEGNRDYKKETRTESRRTEFDVRLGLSSDCPDRVRHQRLLPNASDSGPSPTSEATFSVCDYIGRTGSEAKGRTESVVRVRRTLSNAQTTDRVRGPSPNLWSETFANSPYFDYYTVDRS
ncbi:hypothetical protein LXL04_032664 [Taraxacum kok-saghyz]